LAIAAVVAAGCASSAPHQFGQYNNLGPKVAATRGEAMPQHVTVQLDRPANIAVFLVVPGRASVLLFPGDSTDDGHIQAGSHLLSTSLAGVTITDSARLNRRPPTGSSNGRGGVGGNQGRGGRTTTGRDTLPGFGFNQHGYLLIFAAQQPLPYKTLATRVAGLSVPIDDDDAINTVTKLVRERTGLTGTWAAYSTDFPP
jgi:hypothetical protein